MTVASIASAKWGSRQKGSILMSLLAALFGWHGAPAQMSDFFTKAALLIFGGAYAVFPYVSQGAVTHYQWLGGGWIRL